MTATSRIPDDALERMAPEEMEPRRMKMLRRRIHWARAQSPYYQERLAAVDPRSIRTVADLRQVPFLRREDLEGRFREMVCVPREQWADVARTSGSSGRPVYIPVTLGDLKRSARLTARDLAGAGVRPGEAAMLLLPLDDMTGANVDIQEAFRYYFHCTPLRVGAVPPERQLEYLLEFRPSIIFSAPTPCLRLAQMLQERGIPPASMGVRLLILTGQPLYTCDWEPNALYRSIQALWKADVRSMYGATEYFCGWTECSARRGYHIAWDYALFETVDPDTGELVDGHGELVFTSLTREALPLIRYRTGDITWIERDACGCGRRSPRVMAIVGRADQMVKVKGARLYPQQVEDEVLSVAGVLGHLIEVYRDEYDQDLLRVHVHVEGDADFAVDEIRRRVRTRTRVTPAVVLTPLAELERIWFEHGGRKPLKFRDLRPRGRGCP